MNKELGWNIFYFIWLIGATFTFGVYTRAKEIDEAGSSEKFYKRLALCLTIWPLTLGMAVGRKVFDEDTETVKDKVE